MADFDNVFGAQVPTPHGRFVFFDVITENTATKHPNNKYPSDRFDVTMIFEKTADLSKLQKECESVAQKAFGKVEGVELPFSNGDEKTMDCMKGHIVLRAKAKKKPGLVDEHKEPLYSEDDLRGGMWGRMIVTPFSYQSGRTKGVTLNLKKVQFCVEKPFDPIGGGGDVDFDNDGGPETSGSSDTQPF